MPNFTVESFPSGCKSIRPSLSVIGANGTDHVARSIERNRGYGRQVVTQFFESTAAAYTWCDEQNVLASARQAPSISGRVSRLSVAAFA